MTHDHEPHQLARRSMALVLAGGRGSRLAALTDRRAKPAVNFGGKFLDIIPKIYESAIVAAQRQHVISDTHVGDGSVVGAMESAIEQIKLMAMGMNVGGKIGIARWKEHLCVAVFVEVGVLHFNEVTLGMAHRVLRNDLTDEDD